MHAWLLAFAALLVRAEDFLDLDEEDLEMDEDLDLDLDLEMDTELEDALSPEIHNGRKARTRRRPYLAYLKTQGGCTGTLIRSEFPAAILTAAHCIDEWAGFSLATLFNNYAYLGVDDVNNLPSRYEKFFVWKVHEHENHDDPANIDDIAVVYLLGATDRKTVKLVESGTNIRVGRRLKAFGYGRTETGSSRELMVGKIRTVECPASNNGKHRLCGGPRRNGDVTVDSGDSGGPWITTSRRRSRRKQVAVTGQKGTPFYGADVAFHRDWIDASLAANEGVSGFVSAVVLAQAGAVNPMVRAGAAALAVGLAAALVLLARCWRARRKAQAAQAAQAGTEEQPLLAAP